MGIAKRCDNLALADCKNASEWLNGIYKSFILLISAVVFFPEPVHLRVPSIGHALPRFLVHVILRSNVFTFSHGAPIFVEALRQIIDDLWSVMRTLGCPGIERKAEMAGKSGSMLFLRFENLAVGDKNVSWHNCYLEHGTAVKYR